jgi:ABC-type methionine transport system permease subunit
MNEFLTQLLPNVMGKLPTFYKAIGDTFLMVIWSGSISIIIGLVLGIILTVTKKGGILENKVIYQVIDKIVNLFRAVPFIILLTALFPAPPTPTTIIFATASLSFVVISNKSLSSFVFYFSYLIRNGHSFTHLHISI